MTNFIILLEKIISYLIYPSLLVIIYVFSKSKYFDFISKEQDQKKRNLDEESWMDDDGLSIFDLIIIIGLPIFFVVFLSLLIIQLIYSNILIPILEKRHLNDSQTNDLGKMKSRLSMMKNLKVNRDFL
jgi:hypothetical protein